MERALADPEAIRLEVGEPDRTTPKHVIDAAFEDARAGHTGYTSSTGSLDLRTALAEKITEENQVATSPDQVLVTHGAMQALSMSFLAVLAPGDEVLLPDPEFPNWRMSVMISGASASTYPTSSESGFIPRLEDIEAAITSNTRVIVVCSPNNPTGAVYPADLLAGIVDLARRHDLWVFSDECYEAITFDAEHVSPARFDTDGRVWSFYSFSKTHSMTGWRIGYVRVPDLKLTAPLAQIAEANIACPSSIGQRAALAALRGPSDHVIVAVETYRERRDEAVAALTAAGVRCAQPTGAFYLMVDLSEAFDDGWQAADRLLTDHHVAVAPGETFGQEAAGWVRLSLASDSDALREGVRRIIDVVERARVDRPRPV
jgi:aspartate aminotransferase